MGRDAQGSRPDDDCSDNVGVRDILSIDSTLEKSSITAPESNPGLSVIRKPQSGQLSQYSYF